jgi:aquaporin Z
MDLSQKLAAELLGTLWLVLGGCGSAVLAANFMPETNLGIGLAGVSLAFGLTVLTAAYAFGDMSGGHFNPAVTLGVFAARNIGAREAVTYIVAQVVGAIIGAGLVVVIASGLDGYSATEDGVAANGWANLSPGGFDFWAALVVEVVLTFFFLLVILGTSEGRAPVGFAPIAIGLSLTLIHLVSIPVTNTSVNPARSTGPALFQRGDSIEQLWLFWLAPIVGAVAAGLFDRTFSAKTYPNR